VLSNASSIATNVVMFVIFIGLVTAGVMKGLKDFREFKKPETTSTSATAQVAAATILENVTLSEWTRSNHEVVAALGRLCDMMSRNLDQTAELRRAVEDAAHDIRAHKG
jgi:hypothetical protein